MSFEKWATKIKQMTQVLNGLEQSVRASHEREQLYRRIPAFVNIEFDFASGDFTQKNRTWFNGAEDVFLQGIALQVATVDAPGTSNPTPLKTPAHDVGFLGGRSATDGPRGFWDFEWNFQVSNTGSWYLSPANGANLLASTVLRKQRRDNYLWFRHPQRVPAGDQINAQMKAIRFPDDATTAAQGVTASLVFFGYRNGVLHADD